jgi:alanyl-tRNA synthetase
VVMENRAIQTGKYDQESLRAVALRKPPQVEGLVRVVSVDDLDHSACGGTHPASTGEVGVIHIDRWENRHGGTRISFLCGMRAVRAFRHQSRICRDLAARSSVAIEELPEAIARLTTSLDETRRQLARTRAQWLDVTAATLATQAQIVGEWHIVVSIVEHVEAGELRYLVQRLCEAPDMAVILGIREPAPQFCMARSQNVPVDMNALLRELAGPHGARGGGQAHLAQGGGLSEEQLQGMMRAALEHLKTAPQGTAPETRLA